MARDVTLRQLEYLVAVADLGTLAAAAHATHVSTTGLAAALNELESTMGTPLTVRRRAKGVQLTPAGRLAVERARELLNRADRLVEAVDHEVGHMRGALRVGCFTTLTPWVFPQLLDHFARRHPDVELDVGEDSSPRLVAQLRAGRRDVVVLFASHLGDHKDFPSAEPETLDREGLVVRRLHEARPRVLLPRSHRLAGRESVRLGELDGEPGILLDVDPVRKILTGVLERAGLMGNIAWSTPNANVVRNVVGRGLAWSILVGLGAGMHSPEGNELVALHIEDELPANGVVAVTLAGMAPGPKVLEALDLLTHREVLH